MRNLFLRWPCVALALGLAGLLAGGPAGAAPLPSQISPRLASPEAAAALERLAALGFDSEEAQRRMAALSDARALKLAGGTDRLLVGAGEEKKALGVAAVIIIAVAAIAGFYAFYNSK